MRSLPFILFLLTPLFLASQTDKEQLALQISKADQANTMKLLEYNWKRTSEVRVGGELKSTLVNELSIDSEGKVHVTTLDVKSTSKDKIGIRGRIQDRQKEDIVEYVEKALKLALSYTYMSKGEFLDFFEQAEVTSKDGIIEAKGSNIFVKGDQMTVRIDEKSKLFLHKEFSSKLGEDPVNGEIEYELFKSGISHGSETVLDLPGKNMKIHAKNHDYAKLVM